MNEGWKCPVCGAGVAPHIDKCPCVNNWDLSVYFPMSTETWSVCPTCGLCYAPNQGHICQPSIQGGATWTGWLDDGHILCGGEYDR